jgi:hypothetical protein
MPAYRLHMSKLPTAEPIGNRLRLYSGSRVLDQLDLALAHVPLTHARIDPCACPVEHGLHRRPDTLIAVS